MSLSRKTSDAFINNILKTGKCSELLYHQFNHIVDVGYVDYGFITREIAYLEGLRDISSTKKESQYKHKPLKGLWHKHFFGAQFLGFNIYNQLGLDYGTNKLRQILMEIFEKHNVKEGDLFTEELSQEFSHTIVQGSLVERSKASKLTGDWIIYAKQESGNYYLTFASHHENDKIVYERIKKYL